MTKLNRSSVLVVSLIGLLVGSAALPAFADPYDYDEHRDTIASSAGNANAANIAVQTIDPWPPYSKNTKLNLDGRRASVAIMRYQQNKSLDPKGLNTQTISEQAGPGAQSNTSLQK